MAKRIDKCAACGGSFESYTESTMLYCSADCQYGGNAEESSSHSDACTDCGSPNDQKCPPSYPANAEQLPLHLTRYHSTRDLRTRCYATPAGPLPSVTTILSATANNFGLHAWRKRVGAAEANRISREAAERGTQLHADVESVLLYQRQPSAITPWLASLLPFLARISQAHLVEGAVWHPVGYAGCVDLVATVDDGLAVVDWKTAAKPKLKEWCLDYELQVAAYCAAVSRVYGIRCLRGWVVIALEDCEAQVLEVDVMRRWTEWKERVGLFKAKVAL